MWTMKEKIKYRIVNHNRILYNKAKELEEPERKGGENHDLWNDVLSDMLVFSDIFCWRLGC